MPWRIEQFDKAHHERSKFDCSSTPLNEYLYKAVSQHSKRGISRTYVAIPGVEGDALETNQAEKQPVVGFYTLSVGSLTFDELPEDVRKRMPKYPIPVALIGRLAVDTKLHGQGLGGMLLIDALHRICKAAEQVGIVAVVVDAKDKSAAKFYQHHGFIPLEDQSLKLFLSIHTIKIACE